MFSMCHAPMHLHFVACKGIDRVGRVCGLLVSDKFDGYCIVVSRAAESQMQMGIVAVIRLEMNLDSHLHSGFVQRKGRQGKLGLVAGIHGDYCRRRHPMLDWAKILADDSTVGWNSVRLRLDCRIFDFDQADGHHKCLADCMADY